MDYLVINVQLVIAIYELLNYISNLKMYLNKLIHTPKTIFSFFWMP